MSVLPVAGYAGVVLLMARVLTCDGLLLKRENRASGPVLSCNCFAHVRDFRHGGGIAMVPSVRRMRVMRLLPISTFNLGRELRRVGALSSVGTGPGRTRDPVRASQKAGSVSDSSQTTHYMNQVHDSANRSRTAESAATFAGKRRPRSGDEVSLERRPFIPDSMNPPRSGN